MSDSMRTPIGLPETDESTPFVPPVFDASGSEPSTARPSYGTGEEGRMMEGNVSNDGEGVFQNAGIGAAPGTGAKIRNEQFLRMAERQLAGESFQQFELLLAGISQPALTKLTEVLDARGADTMKAELLNGKSSAIFTALTQGNLVQIDRLLSPEA